MSKWWPCVYEARQGKTVWRLKSKNRCAWHWIEWFDDELAPRAQGTCKRKSDALRRCEKRAGGKLKWSERAWAWQEGLAEAYVEKCFAAPCWGGAGKSHWDWNVKVSFSKGWGLRKAHLCGFAKTPTAAKRVAECAAQQLAAIPKQLVMMKALRDALKSGRSGK